VAPFWAPNIKSFSVSTIHPGYNSFHQRLIRFHVHDCLTSAAASKSGLISLIHCSAAL
jgi:hypothetical protein